MPVIADDGIGKKYGKYDVDRVGLFIEMPYMIDEKYKQPKKMNEIRDLKKAQMYSSASKTKTGLQDAYFDQKFKRLCENEGWKPAKSKSKTEKKNVSTQPFIYTFSSKRHCTPGDYFGTFGPKLPGMSNARRPLRKVEKSPPNMTTRPTNVRGPGYTDIGLSPFPTYQHSSYDVKNIFDKKKKKKEKITPFLFCGTGSFFEKNPYSSSFNKPTYIMKYPPKFKGTVFLPSSSIKNFGNGFDKWPNHSADRYIDPHKIDKEMKNSKKIDDHLTVFYPQSRNKSFYTTSTMHRKLKSAMNNNNWQTIKPITYKLK